jgi:hypothetical protein
MSRDCVTFAVVTVLTVACGGTTATFTPTNAPPRQMSTRSRDAVEVFIASKPDRPFVEIGMIEAQQSSAFSTDDASGVLASLRGEAARRGCDAVLISGPNDAVVGSNAYGNGFVATRKGYRGACIVYRGSDSVRGSAGARTVAGASRQASVSR